MIEHWFGNDVVSLQGDYASFHTEKNIKVCIQERIITLMTWPINNIDSNKKKITVKISKIVHEKSSSTKGDLLVANRENVNASEKDYCFKLNKSKPERIKTT